MNEILAFIFSSQTGADQMLARLDAMDADQRTWLKDAALVSRNEAGDVVTYNLDKLVGNGEFGGMFWGFLFSLIFWSKWWHLTVALSFHDDFVKEIGDALGKGNSGLFIYTNDSEAVLDLFDNLDAEVVRAELEPDEQAFLHSMFKIKQ